MNGKEIDKVFLEKRRFVATLQMGYCYVANVTQSIQYQAFRHMGEYVRIVYPGGKGIYIDVTANSCTAIGVEIAREIAYGNAIGKIQSYDKMKLLDDIWEKEEPDA